MVSVARLRDRKSDFVVHDWILDSGAFSEITRYGRYRTPVEEYAEHVRRWASCGTLLAAVSQDYMCEPMALRATGLTVAEHQRLTIERYDTLRQLVPEVYIMPVLQGQTDDQYRAHLAQYGDRLAEDAWVGVGSVCKRQGTPEGIATLLTAILQERPDLRLHGFGVKTTALAHEQVRQSLATADSMAWSFAARREGRSRAANDYREAQRFVTKISYILGQDDSNRREHWSASGN